ncbi:hypothetical protein UlMin_011181 [Ulmus minor]
MSQLGVILQESLRREGEARTILCFMREQMDDLDGARGRRRSLKERLGLKGMGCCGATWGFRPTAISVRESDDEDEQNDVRQREEVEVINNGQAPAETNPDPVCTEPERPVSGMNLAAALAAERQFRATSEPERENTGPNGNDTVSVTAPGTPLRVSLMRLLEETDGGDVTESVEGGGGGGGEGGSDCVCCVCMGRKKGAAFIPCGHTFCRVCSRELWLNRGSCPLCNRSILEILDIF